TSTPGTTVTGTPSRTPTSTATATMTPTPMGAPSSTPTPSQTPGSSPTTGPAPSGNSLALNGTSAYAEAPNAVELNVSDWTFELWFRDENSGYNHARTRILTKGEITSAEV